MLSLLLPLPLYLVCITYHLLIKKKKQPCLHVEWKEEDRRYGMSVKFRDIYQRDEGELQHCAHVISQLDEKRDFLFNMKWSLFKKLYTDSSEI